MPHSQFLKQSRNKMQAWVTNNGLHGQAALRSQPVPHGSSGFDGTESPEKGHVHQGQPLPAQENLPPKPHYQSRGPIISANRAAAAAAARMTPRSSTPRSAHARQTSLKMERNRTSTSDPLQASSSRRKPFWDESTVDGSMFSEIASNADSRATEQPLMPATQDKGYKPRDAPRQRSARRDLDEVGTLPFVIGDNGMIDVMTAPLQRSSSTPEARGRGNSKEVPHESESYVEETSYQALERSPPKTLNHHRAKLPLRNNQLLSYSERTSHPTTQNGMSSPQEHTFQTSRLDYEPENEQPEDLSPPKTQDHPAHRSTVFENIDTPVVSHPESLGESSEGQRTPKQPKKSPEVNRILFSKGSKGKNSLRESALARLPSEKSEKRQSSSSKKRQFELDYDDAALSSMSYEELKKQSFDVDPALTDAQSVDLPSQGTLPNKLKYFLDKDQDAQASFFTKMPVKDWDGSGDWFLESFGDIMRRLREARHAKRQLVEEFENEVAEREEAVRTDIHKIGQTLGDLRKEGEGLMRRKDLD